MQKFRPKCCSVVRHGVMQGDKQRERCGFSMGGSEVSNAMSCFGTLHSIAMSCHAIQLLVASTHPKEHIYYI